MRGKSSVIFSIPGRIRIRISDLLRKDGCVNKILHSIEEEQGIISVYYNIRTKNILICYQSDQIDNNRILEIIDYIGNKIEINNKIPILPDDHTLKRRHKAAYCNERTISARVFMTALLIGGIASVFDFILSRLIAILIFSFPIVIFVAPTTTFYYAVCKIRNNRIEVSDKVIVDLLDKTEAVYIKDSVLMLKEQHVNMNEFHETFDLQIHDFVFGMRENGITNIAVLVEHNRHFVRNIANQLGIKEIYYFNNATEIRKLIHDRAMLVLSEDKTDFIDETSEALVLYVYKDEYIECRWSDIKVKYNDIDKIPWVIGYSRYCREIVIRCQNIAVAINTMGSIAASLGYIGPLGALIIYGINIIWQPIMIKSRVLSYETEMDNNGR